MEYNDQVSKSSKYIASGKPISKTSNKQNRNRHRLATLDWTQQVYFLPNIKYSMKHWLYRYVGSWLHRSLTQSPRCGWTRATPSRWSSPRVATPAAEAACCRVWTTTYSSSSTVTRARHQQLKPPSLSYKPCDMYPIRSAFLNKWKLNKAESTVGRKFYRAK